MKLLARIAAWMASRRARRDRRFVHHARRWPKVDNSLDSMERHRRETGQR